MRQRYKKILEKLFKKSKKVNIQKNIITLQHKKMTL